MNRIASLLLLVIGATPAAAQARAVEPTGPNIKKLVTFDSGAVIAAVLSPNGRWLAFLSSDGSLWTAPADGRGHAVRITSPHYGDRVPLWFPSSDGLTFTSNRPSRDGSDRFYGMTIGIDPNTGRSSGPPRAVTTDAVSSAGQVSPDGKWIPYVTANGDSIKMVPSTGGTAKPVAKLPDGSAGPPIWYADGKSIGFVSPLRGPKATFYRVAASGGTPVPVEHTPSAAGHHVHGQTERPIRHAELRDSTERLIGALDVPAGMNAQVFNFVPAAIGVMNATRSISHIYSVESGAHRVIDGWSDGWTSDGKNFMVEVAETRPDGSRQPGAALADSSGKIVRRTPMPPDARGCCGWSGVVGSAFTFTRNSSTSASREAVALFVADARSGQVWELAPETFWHDTWRMPLVGRGGQGFADDGRFLYTTLTDQAVEVRAGNEERKATLLRAFSTRDSSWQPKNLNGSHGVAVFGDRIAWTDRTRDSVTVWVARGPSGAPRRVAALASPECSGGWQGARCHTELVWSQRGDALAVATMDEHPLVAVVRVRADGMAAASPTVLQPNVREPWCVRWVDGDQALVMIGRRDRPSDDVFVRPVQPDLPTRLLTPGGASGEWMWVSPDGKEILFPEVVTTGSSIWRVDFVPAREAASARKAKP